LSGLTEAVSKVKLTEWAVKRPNEVRKSNAGKEDVMIETSELPTGLGQLYREKQYVTNVSYRFDVREEAGALPISQQ
jgi:hypothetical protein